MPVPGRRVILVVGFLLLSIAAASSAPTANLDAARPAHVRSGNGAVLPCVSHSKSPHPSSRRPRYVPQEKIRIVDGDTFRNGRERVRIIGYDAPEMGQPRGPAAKTRLTQLLRSGTVTMLRHGKDKYGRTLAFVYVDGKNVAESMRAEGNVK